MKIALAKVANRLYERAPRAYGVMYRTYKSWTDRAERNFLRQVIRPGAIILDIGANIGVYTEFFANLVGVSGKVFAFEPEPQNLARLASVARVYPGVVEVVDAAVSDRSGFLQLHVADDLNVDHRSYAPDETRSTVKVRAVALDDFFPGNHRVDAIKMDIQGAELAALRGARRLLQSVPAPVLLLEYWPYGLRSAGENPADLIAELTGMGFELSTIGDVALPGSLSGGPDQYVNMIATPNGKTSGRKLI